MVNKCKHKWKIITEQTIESPMRRFGGDIKIGEGNYDLNALMVGTYICILQCELCGELDKTIEKI